MSTLQPEVKELISAVKAKYGKSLATSTDFGEFSLHLGKESGEIISVSTLKRLWGYVRDTHEPRGHTLDILSRYAGYHNFDDFCKWHTNKNFILLLAGHGKGFRTHSGAFFVYFRELLSPVVQEIAAIPARIGIPPASRTDKHSKSPQRVPLRYFGQKKSSFPVWKSVPW